MEDLKKATFDNVEQFIETAKATGRFVCLFFTDAMLSKPFCISFGYKNSPDGYEVGRVESRAFATPSEAMAFADKYQLRPIQ